MLKKIMNISCLQATFLSSKKEAGQTTFVENIKLSLHFSICTGCKMFASQSKIISKNAKNASEFSEETLSLEKKKSIKELMK